MEAAESARASAPGASGAPEAGRAAERAPEAGRQPEPMRCVWARVAGVERRSPGFARVTLAAEEFDLMGDSTPYLDCRIKIVFGAAPEGRIPAGELGGTRWYTDWRDAPADVRGAMRTFSIVASRPGEIDVEFALHDASHAGGALGPASQWIASARVGDELQVIGPNLAYWAAQPEPYAGTEFKPGSAERIVLVGDATALPAIESILRDLPRVAAPGAEVRVLAEVAAPDDERDLPSLAGPGPGAEREPASGPAESGSGLAAAAGPVRVDWVRSGSDLGRSLVDALGGRIGAEHFEFLSGCPTAGDLRVASAPSEASVAPPETSPALNEPVGIPGAPAAASEAPRGSFEASAALDEPDGDALLWESGHAKAPVKTYVWVAGEQSAVRDIRRFYVRECGVDRRSVAFMGYWKRGQAQAA
ncbi:siderophore-interacting protein [Arthrobacter sp. UM1]|uniref:siderophore-interacting protein n=1 Tax=Arthrobacter sp. UM1 TaxID=2766776 RepID=UPI001CF6FED4|nr:siderophore-interacting protein [Arthrobacter sp. UM1]MCB4208509.1 siderophore-interacting protein [Arthrobacter sp. UM1]